MRRDRYEKLLHYTKCPSIQEYVLISQDIMLVEIYTRKDQEWLYHRYESGENVELKSIGFTFPIERLYKKAIP